MAEALDRLIEAMQEELQWQQDLAALLQNKLDAMRHYDVSRLEALAINEQRLLQGIHARAKNRDEATHNATRQLLPNRRGKPPGARELARAAQEPERSKLLTLAAMLQEVAEKVQRFNRVNSLASQKILGHFDHIFRIIAQSGRDIGLYGRAGKKALLEQNRLVDALA